MPTKRNIKNKTSRPKPRRSHRPRGNGMNARPVPVRRPFRNGGNNNRNTMQGISGAYGVRTGTNLQKGIRLKKREFITNVGHNALGAKGAKLFKTIRSTSNGFLTSLAELGANVGLTKSFPWLSNVAQFFDKFVFHTCKFEYVPSTGSTSTGTVALCPTYKADESTEGATKADLLDRAGSSRSATWQSNSCSLDPKKANAALKSHFVRTGEVPDKKVCDPARLDVLVETPAADADQDVGELWVDYDVSLEVPKGMTDNRGGSAAVFHVQGASGSPKVLTFEHLPEYSSVVDFGKHWVEADPTGDYYILHLPFKKACKTTMNVKFSYANGQLWQTTSDYKIITNQAVAPNYFSDWVVDAGASAGVFEEAVLKAGFTIKIPMATSVAMDVTLMCAEISDQLYSAMLDFNNLKGDGPLDEDPDSPGSDVRQGRGDGLVKDIATAIENLRKKK